MSSSSEVDPGKGARTTITPDSAASHSADHRGQSRRRGEDLYAAIFNATLAELVEVGYPRLTMERIAARARASKMSLYKRWSNRAELVIAALRHQAGDPEPEPDTGNMRDDVLTLLRTAAARLDGVFGGVVRGLMAESRTAPERTADLRAHMFTDRDRLMRKILERAVTRGEIRPSAITPQLVGLAPALVDHHFLVHGSPIPDALLVDIVDKVLLPLLTTAADNDA